MRKKSHDKILGVESKEQCLNTVSKSCPFQKKMIEKNHF